MDLNKILKTLLSNESIAGVAKKAGVNIQDVKKVVTSALPMLLGGATAQSKNKETAQGFAEALTEHAKNDTSNIGSFLQNIDIEDGAKILGHLFGDHTLNQTAKISKNAGVDKANTGNILSLIAPLFMSSLGQQATPQQTSAAGVGSLMDSLFGGLQPQQQQQANPLGDLFGAMMGGMPQQQQQINPMEDFFNAMMGGMQPQQQQQQTAMPDFFSSMFGMPQQQQQQQVNPFADLFGGLMPQQQQQQQNPMDFFSNFVNNQQQAQQQANPFADLFGGMMGGNDVEGDNVTDAFNTGNGNSGLGGLGGLDILGQLFGGR